MLPKTDAAKYAGKNTSTTLLPNGKLRFDQTGMEFPPTVTRSVLEAYANGKAFRRAVARRENESYDFSVHQPYIVPHKDRDERHFLYCTLTKATLPRNRTVVQNHVSAKRFQRLRKEREERKQNKEEQADMRREKRAQIAAARKASEGKSERRSSEANVGDPKVPMEQDGNDVLDGIISDDDESINSDAEANQSQETANRADNSTDEGQEENIESDRMEVDEIESEEKDTFWVHGRKDARHEITDNDEEEDDEWEEPKKKNVGMKRMKKKNSGTKPIPLMSQARTNDSQTQDSVIGKRNRVTAQVPKKVRQARQRRKSGRRA